MDLVGELNRLANIPTAERMRGAAYCANLWAGTTGLELVGALNVKAGLLPNGTALELNGVLRRLGIIDLDQGGFTLGAAQGGVSELNNTLRLPGISGNYMSTPDAANVSVTGDIDIRVKVAVDDWYQPIGTSGVQPLVAKYASAGNQRSFLFGFSNAFLHFFLSANGTAATNVLSNVVVPLASRVAGWARVTWRSSDGLVQFFTGTDGVSWTQLGTDKTIALANIFDGTALLEVGSFSAGAQSPSVMNVYYAEVRSGIDGPVVAKFDSTQVGVTGERTPTTYTQAARAEAIRLPGVAGNYLSQPDSVANSVTGDIDIRCKASVDDWTPTTTQTLVGKYTAGGASYLLDISGGFLRLLWSQDGTAVKQVSGVAVPFADGTTGWVRGILDVDNGAGGYDGKLFTSVDGVTWTLLQFTTTAGVTNIFDSTTALQIGANAGGTNPLAGSVYSAEVRSGIDGPVVASFNAGNVIATGAKTPATVDLWTINGAAWSWDTAITEPSSGALRLPGVGGNDITTPDAADISITGDIDIRAKVALDDWTPTATQTLVGKLQTAGQYSYSLEVDPAGKLNFLWSSDGTAVNTKQSAAYAFADGSVQWVRVTMVVATGQAVFYTSPDGVTWNILNTASAFGATSIFDGTDVLRVGSRSSWPVAGYVYRAEVYSGVAGTLVAFFDAQSAPTTTNRLPTTVVQSGRTWTLNGALWEWVNQPAPTPWTVNGSAWWWGLSSSSRYNNVLELPGTSGNYASTPDSAALSITGDIDLRVKVAVDSWVVANGQRLVSKTGVTSATDLAYDLFLDAAGALILQWYAGGAVKTVNTPVSLGSLFANGVTKWLRAVLVVATGQATFYSSDDGVTWSVISTLPAAVGATSLADTTAPVVIASRYDGLRSLAGKVHYAEIRNGIAGTVVGVFNPNVLHLTGLSADNTTTTPTTLPSPTGETWTINGSGWRWRVQ